MKNLPKAHQKAHKKHYRNTKEALKDTAKAPESTKKKQERRSLSIPANKIIPLFKRLFYYYPH